MKTTHRHGSIWIWISTNTSHACLCVCVCARVCTPVSRVYSQMQRNMEIYQQWVALFLFLSIPCPCHVQWRGKRKRNFKRTMAGACKRKEDFPRSTYSLPDPKASEARWILRWNQPRGICTWKMGSESPRSQNNLCQGRSFFQKPALWCIEYQQDLPRSLRHSINKV